MARGWKFGAFALQIVLQNSFASLNTNFPDRRRRRPAGIEPSLVGSCCHYFPSNVLTGTQS